jgi:hypothetical protein
VSSDANRVVTSREITSTPAGAPVYRIAWSGDVYGTQLFDYPRPDPIFEQDCYDLLTIGQPLPFACLTVDVLHRETDAIARNEWLAIGSSFLMMGALVLFSMRRINWSPRVAATTEHRGSPAAAGTPHSAVELMRSVESEKGSRVDSLAVGHDIRHPVAVGVGTGVLMIAAIASLVPYPTNEAGGSSPRY